GIDIHKHFRFRPLKVNTRRSVMKALNDLVEQFDDVLSSGSDACTVAEALQLQKLADHDFHRCKIGRHSSLDVRLSNELNGDLQPAQRGSELVTDVDEQLFSCSNHVLDAADHSIEGVGQPAEFVR